MKYMLMFADAKESQANEEQMAAVMKQVDSWWGKYSQSGAIAGGERLQPANNATTVRFSGGAPTIVDGPFAETKEWIAGYAIVEVPDLDAALEMAKSWPASAAVEIRPIWED
ncbi:MAG: YciI family protein [Candidatus Dormiibacterota bacterium]